MKKLRHLNLDKGNDMNEYREIIEKDNGFIEGGSVIGGNHGVGVGTIIVILRALTDSPMFRKRA